MKDNYNYCCSQDGHGLEYPGFSVVFIQTFSMHRYRRFVLSQQQVLPDYEQIIARLAQECEQSLFYPSLADYTARPIVYMNQNIERQIFVDQHEGEGLIPCSERPGYYAFPEDGVYRCSLRGFDFYMPIRDEDEEDITEVDLKGHVNVELSLFFGNTVSLTYRFCFDGKSASVCDPDSGMPQPAQTDHLIALLSTFLGAEYWSREKQEPGKAVEQTNINLETNFFVRNLWFDDEGNPLQQARGELPIPGSGRTFDEVALIYKKYVLSHCSAFVPGLSLEEKHLYETERSARPVSMLNDHHYAMVDLWETLMHPDGKGGDLFSLQHDPRLSEAQIVRHIRDYHKPELIGLMTLYPAEWPYRDAEAYDEVCGENIAIDTDDLVLAGSNLSVVIGTYGRRGSAATATDSTVQKQGVDWSEHLKERAKYHVSWPEYLLLLQMVLVKKHILSLAKGQLIRVATTAKQKSSEKLIEQNAELGMRLSRMILQLDVVKYSKFASHTVMFDRTTRRLRLEEDMENLRQVIDLVDSSLHNLSDYKSMRSDFVLNIVLAIISCASTFELLFQNSEMPFLTYFNIDSSRFSAWLVAIVAGVTIFAILLVFKSFIKKLWDLFVK